MENLYAVAGKTIFPITKLKEGYTDFGRILFYPEAYDIVGYASYPTDAVDGAGNTDKDRVIMRTREEFDSQ